MTGTGEVAIPVPLPRTDRGIPAVRFSANWGTPKSSRSPTSGWIREVTHGGRNAPRNRKPVPAREKGAEGAGKTKQAELKISG